MTDRNGNYYSANLGRPAKVRTGDSRPQDRTTAPASPPPGPSFQRPDPVFSGAGDNAMGSAVPIGPGFGGPDIFDLQAEAYLLMAYGPITAYFSPEARPDEGEHEMLKTTLAAWFRKMKKMPEIHEGVTFGLVAFGVFAGKLSKPTVREKWNHAVLGLRQLWARWTGKGNSTGKPEAS